VELPLCLIKAVNCSATILTIDTDLSINDQLTHNSAPLFDLPRQPYRASIHSFD
jgi:hypothetical protein